MEPTTSALAIAFALLCVVLCFVTSHRRRRLYEQASKFEGPPVLPIIGNANFLLRGNKAILKSIAKLTKSCPSPFRFWVGHRLFLVVADPEQLKTIFLSSKSLEKSWMYEFLKPMFGTGLITAAPSAWRKHRKLIQPTFNSKLMNSFVGIIASQSKLLAYKFERNLGGPEFEVFDLVALTAIHTLCETMMGLEVDVHESAAYTDYVNALQKAVKDTCKRIFNIWLHPDSIFNRSEIGKEFWRSIKIIRDFTSTVIERRKSELLMKRCSGQSDRPNTEEDESTFMNERMPPREPFLNSILKLAHEGDQWSDEELRDEVTTMMIAGFDSTAITNTHIMMILASHPDVQEKVHQELYDIYGDADIDERPVTHEDLGRMEYLERVIKETMRLFPLLPLIARKVTDDLEIGEHTLPEGSEVVIPVLEVHRSDKYWPDPLEFNPDRFLAEEIAKRHPYTYLAFSTGPRNCIGMKYAMMTMKTLHATILRRFVLKKDNIVPVKDIRLKYQLVLKTVEPVKFRIKKRSRNQME